MLVIIANSNIRNALRRFSQNKVLIHLLHGLSNVSIHYDFSAQNKTASLHLKVIERDAVLLYSSKQEKSRFSFVKVPKAKENLRNQKISEALELLARFELATSSLPRMRSTD